MEHDKEQDSAGAGSMPLGGPAGAPVLPAIEEPPREALLSLLALYNAGRHDELEAAALRTAAQYPRSARALHLLGASRLSRGRHTEAAEALRSALGRVPGDPDINNLLGVALSRCGRHDEARACFEASLSAGGENYETLVNASANANAAGDVESGRKLAARALELRPNGVEAMLNLGNALLAAGRGEEAIDMYRRAIALAPKASDLSLNLGEALMSRGRHDEAAAAFRQALALRPDYAPAHLNLGRALHELGDTIGAQRHFRAASDHDPGLTEAHSAYLFSLSHDPGVSPRDAYAEHVRIGELIERPCRDRWREHENDRDPERDLRIGFVSGDLHEHPLANLIEPVWRAIRAGRNRLYVYANGTWRDAVEARLKALAHEWLHVERMNDDQLAERIRADRIDILFDLSGHTARNRLLVFARKPAPIQVTWLGYPGTTGLSAIDYHLMRGHESVHEALQALFRERLVHFRARSFEPPPESPAVSPLPALRRGWLTFGSFNRPSKLGAGVIALWSRVLVALPEARLLIAGANEDSLRARLRAEFSSHGIASSRIDFRPRVAMGEYLALHHEVDIALDTFPYTGGTTTNFALWMGVPVLTLAGASLQQRQSAAILTSFGLADWVTGSEEEFVARARRAAADLPALGRLRVGLREVMEQRMQGSVEGMADQLDAAFRAMWRRWCRGQPPEGFVVGT